MKLILIIISILSRIILAESTIFVYELTDAVEKFTFTIYTVEGRKIQRLENDNIISGANINFPGYHEIE